MKKLLILLAVFSMVLYVAGCGGDGAAAVKPADKPGEKVTPASGAGGSDQSPVSSEKKMEETAEKTAETPAEKSPDEDRGPAEQTEVTADTSVEPAAETVAPEEEPAAEPVKEPEMMPVKTVKKWRSFTWPSYDMNKIKVGIGECTAKTGGSSGKKLAETVTAELQNVLLATGRYALIQGVNKNFDSIQAVISDFEVSPNNKRWKAVLDVTISKPGRKDYSGKITAAGFSTESSDQAAERAAADAVLQILTKLSK